MCVVLSVLVRRYLMLSISVVCFLPVPAVLSVRCFVVVFVVFFFVVFVFFQAEDGIRDLVRSRGLGDVYKRQV